MSDSTLLVVHHETNNEDLKSFVTKAMEAHANASTKYYTYRPMHGPSGVSYVWFPHSDDAQAKALHSGATVSDHADTLAAAAKQAKSAVKGIGSDAVKTIARNKSSSGPAPFVLAVGVKAKPGKMGQLIEAGREMAANSSGVEFTVHKGGSTGDDSILVMFHLNSIGDLDPDGPINSPMLTERLGADAASALGSKMMDAIAGVWQQPLRHMPHLSAA